MIGLAIALRSSYVLSLAALNLEPCRANMPIRQTSGTGGVRQATLPPKQRETSRRTSRVVMKQAPICAGNPHG
jgi:hypothetical protein